ADHRKVPGDHVVIEADAVFDQLEDRLFVDRVVWVNGVNMAENAPAIPLNSFPADWDLMPVDYYTSLKIGCIKSEK
ncbi:MAG TPA: hypothetical protein PLW27_11545, partial [Kiritimatiellia bacterium]|nr:hypothetical protein [Kiritimatiellia bacterium]